MKRSPAHELYNIQMLRAIAAILVLLHHAYPHYQAMGGKIALIGSISGWGFAGVDIFFVISGFIMAYTTFNKQRGIRNAGTFIKHRLFRIYLGYWPFFFVMLAALYVTDPMKLHSLDIAGSFFLTNADMFQLVLPVSWSLSYELYFYLLFLFTFFFSVKQLYRLIPLFVIILFLLVIAAFKIDGFSNNFFYSPFLLEFFSGVLLYMYRGLLVKRWGIPLSIVMILLAYGLGVGYETKNGLYRVLTFGTGAFFVMLLALILEQEKLYRTGTFLESLGNASYTLYLSHLILLQLFYVVGLRGVFTGSGTLMPLAGLISMLLLSVVFSLFYYRLVERPVYQKAIRL